MAFKKPTVPPLNPAGLDRLQTSLQKKYKRKLKLTTPLYSMAHLANLLVRADSDPYEADFSVAIPGKPDSKPMVMRVTNLEDGESALLILNTIMLSALKRLVDSPKGRLFKFTSGGIDEGKQYRRIEVEEIEEVED